MNSIPLQTDGSNVFIFKVYIYLEGKETMETISGITTGINMYSLYVQKNTKIGLLFNINDTFTAYKYLLKSSVSISVLLENERIPTEK